MKNKFQIIIIASCVLIVSMTACTKKIDEAYLNPNASVTEPIESLLPGVIGNFLGSSSAAGSSYGLGGDALLIGRYIQYWGTYSATSPGISYTAANANNYDQMGGTVGSSDNLGSVWGAFYYGQGQNLNRIIQWGSAQKKWDYVGVALAIRAWGWLELANEYGDALIIKQAFNTSLQQFTYDPQSLAYDSCRAAAYSALQYLNNTGGSASPANLAIGDAYFYNGDVNKWKEFVYGILARSFHYINNKSTYSADSVIKYCNLSIQSNTDNATCKFANSGLSGTDSYFGILRANVGTIRQSQYIANLLSGQNSTTFSGVADPRIWYMLRENPNGTFKGITPWSGTSGLATNDQPQNFWGSSFATTAAPANENACRYLFRNTAEFPVMTASEIQFIKAEAAYIKGDKATALTAYTTGISLNFDMLVNNYATNVPAASLITPAMKASYLANPAVVPPSASALTPVENIIIKWSGTSITRVDIPKLSNAAT